jgi:hypothetical protein
LAVEGAAWALVDVLVDVADDEALGSDLVSEPQPVSTRARVAASAAAPVIAVDLIN